MIFEFILWMIFVSIAAKIIGQLVRTIRIMLMPNRTVMHRKAEQQPRGKKIIEDIPYEEIKDK